MDIGTFLVHRTQFLADSGEWGLDLRPRDPRDPIRPPTSRIWQEIIPSQSKVPELTMNRLRFLRSWNDRKSPWTLFGPQNPIFDRFCHMGTRFTSQRPTPTTRDHKRYDFVSGNRLQTKVSDPKTVREESFLRSQSDSVDENRSKMGPRGPETD